MVALFLCCFAQAEAHGKLVEINLHPDVTTSKRVFSIGDLADVLSEDAELKRTVEEIKIGNAPRIGYVEKLTRQDLEEAVRSRVGRQEVEIRWHGANSVRFRSAGQLVDMELLITAAKKFALEELHLPFKNIEIQIASELTEVEVPVGDLEFRARKFDSTQPSSRYPVWVDIYVNGRLGRAVIVPLKLTAHQEVLIAKRELSEGAVITKNDFEVKTEDIVDLADPPIDKLTIEGGLRLKRRISSGQVLTKNYLYQSGAVLRGDIVHLAFVERNVTIEVNAVAQEDGRVGEMIKVKPDTSREAIVSRVVAPGIVQIDGR